MFFSKRISIINDNLREKLNDSEQKIQLLKAEVKSLINTRDYLLEKLRNKNYIK